MAPAAEANTDPASAARAAARTAHLSHWRAVQAAPAECAAVLLDGSTVRGTLAGVSDGDGTLLRIRDLLTPLGRLDRASLRLHDVASLEVALDPRRAAALLPRPAPASWLAAPRSSVAVQRMALPAAEGAAAAAAAAALAASDGAPAAVGAGIGRSAAGVARDDAIVWVGAADRPPGLEAALGVLARARAAFVEHGKKSGGGWRPRLCSKTSTQLAVYGGGGDRYARHADAHPTAGTEPTRQVTAILYLNADWTPEDGGCLRLHGVDGKPFVDVPPEMGTLVLFRSDAVEHEVRPSSATRLALTQWWYGWPDLADCTAAPPPAAAAAQQLPLSLHANILAFAGAAAATAAAPSPPPAALGPPPLPLPRRAARAAAGLSASAATAPPPPRIFVAIPSYRDSELHPTLESLRAAAHLPDRVVVGVCAQYDWDADGDCLRAPARPAPPAAHAAWLEANVTWDRVDAADAAGPCVARARADALADGSEEYVLRVDSHMRFRKNWDAYLIDALKRCGGAHPVVTTYPSGYTIDPTEAVPNDTAPTVLAALRFDETGMLRQKARSVRPSASGDAIPSPLWAGGFNFCAAATAALAPYDPHLRHMFFGEEPSMAVRLFTHGADFFAPAQAVCYHLWTRDHRPSFREKEAPDRSADQARALARVQALFGLGGGEGAGDEAGDGERYGLGGVRTLADFERSVGVDFGRRAMVAAAEKSSEQSAGEQVAKLLGLVL